MRSRFLQITISAYKFELTNEDCVLEELFDG